MTYLDPGPPDKRVIAQLNHELDIIHDTSPEGVFTLVKDSPTSKGWFDGFPYGHPDPTLPQVIFNHQNPKFQNRDVRWALALALDIKAIVDGGLSRRCDDLGDRRSADRHASGITITSRWRSGSRSFEIDTGKKVIKPYDATVGQQIADMLRPSMGDQIPTDPDADRRRLRPRLVEAGHRGGRRSSSSAPASPGAATTGTCRTASASPSRWWSKARRARS